MPLYRFHYIFMSLFHLQYSFTTHCSTTCLATSAIKMWPLQTRGLWWQIQLLWLPGICGPSDRSFMAVVSSHVAETSQGSSFPITDIHTSKWRFSLRSFSFLPLLLCRFHGFPASDCWLPLDVDCWSLWDPDWPPFPGTPLLPILDSTCKEHDFRGLRCVQPVIVIQNSHI